MSWLVCLSAVTIVALGSMPPAPHSARLDSAEEENRLPSGARLRLGLPRYFGNLLQAPMTFSRDGRVVVSIGREAALYVWNAQEGAMIQRLPLHTRPKCIVLDRQNSQALCGLPNGKIGVVELKVRQGMRETGDGGKPVSAI